MKYRKSFKEFDPMNGEVPYLPYPLLNDLVWRARVMLKNRKTADVQMISDAIDDRIDEYFELAREKKIQELLDNKQWEYFNIDDDGNNYGLNIDREDELDFPSRHSTRYIDALEEIIADIENPLADGKAPSEVEYFAVLALQYAELSIQDIVYSNDIRSGKRQKEPTGLVARDYASAGNFALEAMEALGRAELARNDKFYAEHISSVEKRASEKVRLETEEKWKLEKDAEHKRRKDHMRMMAKESHKERDKAKEAALKRYETDPALQGMSNTKAGRKLSDWLKTQDLEMHEPRTVTGWISDYKKEKTSKSAA